MMVVPENVIRQGKKIVEITKEEVKLSLFTEDNLISNFLWLTYKTTIDFLY